ncbi:helix-turn-helix domain-containing protein [Frigoriglobus tundricola]|uniref:Transcriptional regulator n=1 Tax=Frigoriglobus tundricola TaxID=2774151 RepID=A0A6M5Z5J4_9BACT|nr:helix-turn-helix transcriptional regulator [Frigoriglobus tundricola]QJX01356.1 transcriptional regulator [Frigoriglobus tundricola]
MIKNESEYREAVEKRKAELLRLEGEQTALAAKGFTPDEVTRATQPAESFHAQLREEIESYERLRRGDFEELNNFQGLGRLLIVLRIYRGLSQRQLAEELGVHESQVSRDERNEYHGITVERTNRILDALGVELHTQVAMTANSDRSAGRKSRSAANA